MSFVGVSVIVMVDEVVGGASGSASPLVGSVAATAAVECDGTSWRVTVDRLPWLSILLRFSTFG